MARFLSKEEQAYYNKHLKRTFSNDASKGERKYSERWLSGFDEVWSNDGRSDKAVCKNDFEKKAFERGQNFAKKVHKRK